MPAFSATTTGVDRLTAGLLGLAVAAEREEDWWVGTSLFYARFVEFGTAKMGARPFFRPAIQRVRAGRLLPLPPQSGSSDPETMYEELVGEGGATARMARSLEFEALTIIQQKNLIESAQLVHSIAAAPGPRSRMRSASRKQRRGA